MTDDSVAVPRQLIDALREALGSSFAEMDPGTLQRMYGDVGSAAFAVVTSVPVSDVGRMTDLPDAAVELTDEERDIMRMASLNGTPTELTFAWTTLLASIESIVVARLAAASVSWAEQLDTANAMEPHEKELRKLWREVAEKGIEQGVDWSRIVLTLFADLDAALARNAELETERDRLSIEKYGFEQNAHNNLRICREAESERDAARAELDSLRDRVTALADEWEKESAELYEDAEGDEKIEVEAFTLNSVTIALRAAIVRGTNDA